MGFGVVISRGVVGKGLGGGVTELVLPVLKEEYGYEVRAKK